MPAKKKPEEEKKVPEIVKQAIRGGIKEPQLAEIAAHFFQRAGGARAVARLLYEEFTAARPGSIIRQRILDMILRVTKFANEKSVKPDDLGLLNDDDLETELTEAIKSVERSAWVKDATAPGRGEPEEHHSAPEEGVRDEPEQSRQPEEAGPAHPG